MMEFTINQIAMMLQGEVEGNGSEKVNTIGKIQDAEPGAITFLSNPKYENFIYTSRASAVIVKKDFQPQKKVLVTMIRVADPYSSFTLLLEEYYKIRSFSKTGVEEAFAVYAEKCFGAEYEAGELNMPNIYGKLRREWDPRHVFSLFVQKLFLPGQGN